MIADWNAPWMSREPLPQDVAEADQDRQADAAQLQVIDELLQIDRRSGSFVACTRTWPFGADGEVALAPAFDFVELGGVGDGPGIALPPRASLRGSSYSQPLIIKRKTPSSVPVFQNVFSQQPRRRVGLRAEDEDVAARKVARRRISMPFAIRSDPLTAPKSAVVGRLDLDTSRPVRALSGARVTLVRRVRRVERHEHGVARPVRDTCSTTSQPDQAASGSDTCWRAQHERRRCPGGSAGAACTGRSASPWTPAIRRPCRPTAGCSPSRPGIRLRMMTGTSLKPSPLSAIGSPFRRDGKTSADRAPERCRAALRDHDGRERRARCDRRARPRRCTRACRATGDSPPLEQSSISMSG